MQEIKSLGKHLIVELFDCNPEILDDLNLLEEYLKQQQDVQGQTIVNWTFHKFNPNGVSGVVIIQESHLSIHTWVEYRYQQVDLFTCGDNVDPWKQFEFLKQKLQSNRMEVKELVRGRFEDIGVPDGSPYKISPVK